MNHENPPKLGITDVNKIIYTSDLQKMANGKDKILIELERFESLDEDSLNQAAQKYVQKSIQRCERNLENHNREKH